MSLGFTIADQGGCYLAAEIVHPPQGAFKQAREEMDNILAGYGREDTLVLAGTGLGWHLRAALNRPGRPALVAYEPDAGRRAYMAALGPSLDGFEIAGDEDALCEQLGQRLVYGQPGKVKVFSPQAYSRAAPEVGQKAREMVERMLSRYQANRTTISVHGNCWQKYLADNIKHTLDTPDITQMAGIMAGLPAVVVGAGPSLDESLDMLTGVTGKALVLAAASALGPLARVGAPPHLALALEAKDESRQFEGADFSRTVMAAATCSNPRHFTQWPGLNGLFHLQPWMAQLCGLGTALPTGGHATSAAFSLAILWGCDPIVLVGQDLAYSGGRIHASGRPGGEEDGIPDGVSVRAIGGGMTQTSNIMDSYINWYQEAAGWLKRRHPQRRVINSTAQGALIPGFKHQPLEEILQDFEDSPLDFNQFRGAISSLPRTRADFLAGRLSQARAQVMALLNELETGGVERARKAVAPDSAAAAALAQLDSKAGTHEAKEKLESLAQDLRRMREEIYG